MCSGILNVGVFWWYMCKFCCLLRNKYCIWLYIYYMMVVSCLRIREGNKSIDGGIWYVLLFKFMLNMINFSFVL